ncbi:ribonuclease D [Mixta tenebrionis]|uniref:Ribonuclease D n=1 Tax=Mixta tenebrionis TaxID=2562439 RepID=A0A506VCJ8_9GAMM|nr:ribonuclease D [Mixta tenebrionis]TPW43189.1 ribonuclease D [Mixta tenebrionis]
MNYTYITTNEALEACCEAARQHRAIALDTEFVRTRTYYPQLGLLQIYDGEQVTLVDPLTITAWQPLINLLSDEKVTKFLHAGSEDLEVFLHSFGVLPTPLIDTQILAAFSGRPLSMGFAAMVEAFTGEVLDKSESRTDWLARPLSARQCDYAAADVFWLLPIAHTLMDETASAGRLEAARSECQLLCQRRTDILQPQEAYREIGNAALLRPRQLAVLQRLAAWRLKLAREKNMAVNFVVREENLWKVARYQPGSLGELDHLGLSGHEIRFHGKAMLEMVAEADALPEESLPPALININEHPHYKKAFKALKAVVQGVSERSGLSTELLASRRQINQLLSWHWQIKPRERLPELVSGWRGELMEPEIRQVLADYPQ